MHAAYSRPRCVYFVLERAAEIVGGGGIAPLDGGSDDTCELKKMYFLPQARGHGMGEAIVRQCLDAAKRLGYALCYLETLERMTAARALYEGLGFKVEGVRRDYYQEPREDALSLWNRDLRIFTKMA